MKKIKFVSIKHLKNALAISKLNNSSLNLNNIPYFIVSVKDSERISLNIFDEDGYIDINNIRWVKITIPSLCIEDLKLDAYNYGGEKIRIVKPERKFYRYDEEIVKGIVMSFELFDRIINMTSYLTDMAISADSIKLLDNNNRMLAYVLPEVH